jgi:hypothetical protein
VSPLTGLEDLRAHGRMTWNMAERGWAATPEDVVLALTHDGFVECKRAMTTSRRDRRPVGGVWEGVDARTGSIASAVWVCRRAEPEAIVFIAVDGQSLEEGCLGAPDDVPHSEDGGEG